MHVLATQALSLDEADQAIDLAQSPADMVVLSFSDTDLSALGSALACPEARVAVLAPCKLEAAPSSHVG